MPAFPRLFAPWVAALLVALSSGCEQKPPAPPVAATNPGTAPSTTELANLRDFVRESAPRPGLNLPPGHPAVGDTTAPIVPSQPTGEPDRLKYAAPSEWVEIPVRAGGFRSAQYRLPRATGDNEDGELAIFLPGIGGDVEANIARWRSQFTTSQGEPLPDAAVVRETLQVNGLKVTVLDVAGRYNPGAGMAMGTAPTIRDNYRMYAAIVETPDGPRFIKAVGPQATMEQHRAAFVEFVRSLRLE